MKKRVVSLMLVIVFAVSVLPAYAIAANGSLSNFRKVTTYESGQFSDVPAEEWYAGYVQSAYEYGLVGGKSSVSFEPDNDITIGETVKLAACIYSKYYGDQTDFSGGTPWYRPYVDYALKKNIITSEFPDYNAEITRSDFAVIMAAALPDEALAKINDIADNALPDVPDSYSYAPQVYKLYRAGILTGGNDTGAFNPNSYIKRSEVAAIVVRMTAPDYRKTFSLPDSALTATEISQRCSPAVFYIALYNNSGTQYAEASGFFISASGMAVTDYHVIKDAASAKIKTAAGKTYDVAGVYDYSKENDLALLQIDGSGFPYLDMGDSDSAATGETVYAIGCPLGLNNTLSQGIISNADSTVNGRQYIQTTASISSGSSGGALIDAAGKVIGVTCATAEQGQNINLAVPVNLISGLSRAAYKPLSSLALQSGNLTITASPSSLALEKGGEATVTLTASSDDYDTIAYRYSTDSVVSSSWGDWNGNSIPLTVTGINAGTTKITVGLLDSSQNLLASTTIDVTVSGGDSSSGTSSQAAYYSGYSPVPDFGTYAGVPLFDEAEDSSGAVYSYAFSQVPEAKVDGYFNLLEQNGFKYVKSIITVLGVPAVMYSNGTLDVYFEIGAYEEGEYCYSVVIIPE